MPISLDTVVSSVTGKGTGLQISYFSHVDSGSPQNIIFLLPEACYIGFIALCNLSVKYRWFEAAANPYSGDSQKSLSEKASELPMIDNSS